MDFDSDTTYLGTLVKWDDKIGYGFIHIDGADCDVFVPGAIIADSARCIGARLRLQVTPGPRGWRAVWAALIDD